MSGRTFFWAELKSNDFRELDPETTIAILPVAAIEQDGPHLPVMTDMAIAEGMIGLLKGRLPRDELPPWEFARTNLCKPARCTPSPVAQPMNRLAGDRSTN